MAMDGAGRLDGRPEPGSGAEESGFACTGWDSGACAGTPFCPPRCPRFVDRTGCALVLRPLEPGDVPPLVDMYDGMEQTAMGLPPYTRRGIEQWLDDLLADGWNLLAVLADRVVGHVGLVPAGDRVSELVVFVDDAFQNRGIGSELLRHAVAHAGETDADALTLVVTPGNRAAVTVYRRTGFEVVERTSMDVEMRLPLDDVDKPVHGAPGDGA